ncbi:MAG: DeoR family transcriptional regulator [Bacteriovoracaceae bacterium]
MTKKPINFKELFTKGDLQSLWKLYQKKEFSQSDVPWVIATLCFRGSLTEAKILTKGKSTSSQNDFFFLLASVRKGEYLEAKTWLKHLAKRYRSNCDSESAYFYFQALAFYAHFHGRYRLSLSFTERSREQALMMDEVYWKILALDLLGHNLVQMGDIFQGLFYLEEAKSLAKLIGNNSVIAANEVSIASYKAQFSQTPEEDEKMLRKHLKTITGVDNYSEGLLLLSLAHLELLTGKMSEALKTMERARKVIFAFKLSRHMAMWHFEMAYAQYLTGKLDLSLHSLTEAQRHINPQIDKRILLKVLGLKHDILSTLGHTSEHLKEEIIQLTRIIGDPRAFNKLARYGWGEKQMSQDPLTAFFDEWKSPKWEKALQSLVVLGHWGLLRDKVQSKKENYIISGLWKNGILFITPEAIHARQTGVSELLRKMLREISFASRITKASLVKNVWGHEYDPIRHDNLIYTQISRVRQVLGPLKHILIGEDHSYRLFKKFQWVELNPLIEVKSVDNFYEHLPNHEKFNIRQLQALHLLKTQPFWQVRLYAEHFSVTPMTALRDLSELSEMGLIKKVGKARATVYTL